MKNLIFFLLIFISNFSFSQTTTPANKEAYKYILDYDVPSSPAFTALDATPQQVTRGGAVKPLVASAFSNFLQTGKLDPGMAVDFSPYILLGGGFKNLDDYKKKENWHMRMLANTMLSAAVLKNSKDSSNSDIGLGVRITFHDSHDLFSSKLASGITNKIGTALATAAKAPTVIGVPPDEIGTDNAGVPGTVPVDLSRFYTDAYNEIRKTPGWALSLGYGYRTTAKAAVIVSDSLINKQSKLWLSGTWYTGTLFNVYGTVQGTFPSNKKALWIAGMAVGSKNKSNNMGAEIVYDFLNKEINYGANFEIKILDKFTYVISLGKRTVIINGVDVVNTFRVISNFRINLFGH